MILFLIFTNFKIFSQFNSAKDIFEYNKHYSLNVKKTDSILSNNYKSEEIKALKTSLFSRFFYRIKDLKSAINYSEKSVKLFEKNNIKSKEYHNSLYLLGLFKLYNNEVDNAIIHFKKASNLNLYIKKKGQALCQLGTCYQYLGDLKKSIDYFEKGIKILKKEGKKSSIVAQCINMSASSNFIDEKSKIKIGIRYLIYADSLIKANPKKIKRSLINNIYTNLANLYAKPQISNYNKAKFYYSLAIKKAILNRNNFFIYLNYMNYGEFLLKNNKDSSKYYLIKSINKNPSLSAYDTIVKAESHRNLSEFYLIEENYNESLKNINNSLSLSFNTHNAIPEKIKLIKTNRRSNILKALYTKIKILNRLYLENKDSRYLTQIIETVNISDQLIEIILEDSTEASTQFSWRNDVSKIYNYGIYAAKLLGDDNLQFQYLEKNKAFLLTQSINDNNYSLNLPNHIVNEELHYKKQILQLENQVSNTETKQLKDSLFDLKFAYQNFKDSIQKVYPQHFESKAKVKLTSLQNVRQQINDKTVIVSYAIQNNETTAINISSGLLIAKDKTIPFSIPNIKKLKEDLHLYRQLISKPLNSKKEVQQYNTIGNSLYNSLFPSEEIKNLIQNKKVVIIPDDNLQNIPFEAFVTDTTSNRFLIEDTDVSYAYSMSFLNVNNNISRVSEKDFAGFAPIEFQNKNLATLQYSAEEINSINDNLNGTIFTGADVTKDSFFTNASNAKIIHLATHADVSKKPVIHFSKDSLNLHELYTYKNNADLVVLSACETNVGELKKGEGILNLARSFFYSGSKSVVSSLWKVNDAATTELMTNFYSNLKDHQSKSEALNNAKRKYLKTHSLSEKSPYYWASFILIGDTAPTFENNNFIYWVFLGFVSLFLLVFISKKLINRGK
ncbi:CHAT domain-containing protein [Tenacibaculum sp. ZS6-P6]|uniref:CHAT domain-containing protein n=1 Tax=Tenacibaculum sp. ZS6-P6 TaxID=3447503 RepID=UPI003F94ACB9